MYDTGALTLKVAVTGVCAPTDAPIVDVVLVATVKVVTVKVPLV